MPMRAICHTYPLHNPNFLCNAVILNRATKTAPYPGNHNLVWDWILFSRTLFIDVFYSDALFTGLE